MTNKVKFNSNRFGTIILCAAFGLSMLAGCKKDNKEDEGPKYNSVVVENPELKAALQRQDFTFDDAGKLIVDDKVTGTTTLDLSSAELTGVAGLELFPNLTEVNLANNKFGYVFDFAALPAKISAINLAGNEIYEYPGLVSVVTEENGDETVTTLRSLTKLYLPESARHNCDEIVRFHTENPAADMKIADANGQLAAYNTLREVPDEILRTYLKTNFPSLFDANNPDVINIANRITNPAEAIKNLAPNTTLNIQNVEGSQYVAMNPSFKGVQIRFVSKATTGCDLKYLRLTTNVSTVYIDNVNTDYINWTGGENLIVISIKGDKTIEQIDLSASSQLGQRGEAIDIRSLQWSQTVIANCPKLKTVTWNSAAQYTNRISCYSLPLLEELDLSNFKGIAYLTLGDLPCLTKLVYYTPDGYYLNTRVTDRETGVWENKDILQFTMTEDIYLHSETKAFLDAYNVNIYSTSFRIATADQITTLVAYDWAQYY